MNGLDIYQWNTRLNKIIDELNSLEFGKEDIGPSFIELLEDIRADDGLPPLTEKERAAAIIECDQNADALEKIDAEQENLRTEYYLLSGKLPYYNALGRYERAWHEVPPSAE